MTSAYCAGSRRSTGNTRSPTSIAAHLVTFAHRQLALLSAADGDHVARQRFIGGNPHLREDTPITAIREGRQGEVAEAVEAFISGAVDA
ncbi:hypothetical protein [uncultured Microbacterium sp.]|uniref:hypothetical protein n=1 Tax=uncultured Microbacterium sp. TaxID=191216 RepID=UPI0028D08E6B|nr:hypothetical protein [uncultured Microbacterium sp.]